MSKSIAQVECLPVVKHMLFTMRKDNLDWPELFAEYVDNAFDEGGGNARNVRIVFNHKAIAIVDDGIGVDDVNRLGRPYDSLSYHSDGSLGQHGIGAKGWLKKADRFRVVTVRDNAVVDFTFDIKKLGPNGALLGFGGKPVSLKKYDVSGDTTLMFRDANGHIKGTMVLLASLRPNKPIYVNAIVAQLQRLYWPALNSGRSIEIHDMRKSPTEVIALEAIQPPEWYDPIDISGTINGRDYKAKVGILTGEVGRHSGLFIGYLFRNVRIEKSFPKRAIPPRIHGQVELSAAWKMTLSEYKDRITEDYDELLLDIESKITSLLKDAELFSQVVKIAGITSEMTITIAQRDKNGSEEIHVGERERGEHEVGPNPNPNPPLIPDPKSAKVIRAKRRPRVLKGFIRFSQEYLGTSVAAVDVRPDGAGLVVIFNLDCPKVHRMANQARYPGLWYAAGEALGFYATTIGPDEIGKIFGAFLGESKHSKREQMVEALRVWFAFNLGEAEAALSSDDDKVAEVA